MLDAFNLGGAASKIGTDISIPEGAMRILVACYSIARDLASDARRGSLID
jgi:hypothetical protein